LVATLLLAGCVDPNLYTTPRTLNPGKAQAQAAPELIVVNAQQGRTSSPMAIVGARIGVLDGLEVGVREQFVLGSLAMDFKVRLLKGRLDLALDPGLQVLYLSDGTPAYFHAAVLLGINAWDWLSAVLSPGLVYYTANPGGPSGAPGGTLQPGEFAPTYAGQAPPMTGAMARIGCGLDLRITHNLAIHPEVTFLKPIDLDMLVGVIGIGFNVGAQPDYSDLAGPPEAPAAPVQAPPVAPPAAPPPAPVQRAPTAFVF
jgi:hypothetical protein